MADDIDWTPGLRLRSGSPTMLQDEMARFEAQLAKQRPGSMVERIAWAMAVCDADDEFAAEHWHEYTAEAEVALETICYPEVIAALMVNRRTVASALHLFDDCEITYPLRWREALEMADAVFAKIGGDA